MKKVFAQFVRETEGQDLIEYALLAATISIVVILGMQAVAGALNQRFTDISNSVGS
jgi:Flp pilus assembly pilin Flp